MCVQVIHCIHVLLFQVPIVIPIIVLIASIWLVVAPIVDQPRIEFLYAFLFIVGGLIFYIPFVYYKIKIPGVCKRNIAFVNNLTLKVLVTTIDAQWEGMGDVGSARYELALLPPCPTIRVLSYSNL